MDSAKSTLYQDMMDRMKGRLSFMSGKIKRLESLDLDIDVTDMQAELLIIMDRILADAGNQVDHIYRLLYQMKIDSEVNND